MDDVLRRALVKFRNKTAIAGYVVESPIMGTIVF